MIYYLNGGGKSWPDPQNDGADERESGGDVELEWVSVTLYGGTRIEKCLEGREFLTWGEWAFEGYLAEGSWCTLENIQ